MDAPPILHRDKSSITVGAFPVPPDDPVLGAVDVFCRAQKLGHDFASDVEVHPYALTLEFAQFLICYGHIAVWWKCERGINEWPPFMFPATQL